MSTQSPELESLKTLRDEIRLKAHLAVMDAKTEWEKLEPQLNHALSTAGTVARETIEDLRKRATELSIRLKA